MISRPDYPMPAPPSPQQTSVMPTDALISFFLSVVGIILLWIWILFVQQRIANQTIVAQLTNTPEQMESPYLSGTLLLLVVVLVSIKGILYQSISIWFAHRALAKHSAAVVMSHFTFILAYGLMALGVLHSIYAIFAVLQ